MKLSPTFLATCLVVAPAFADAADEPSGSETIIVTGHRDLDEKPDVAGRLGLSVRETPATIDIVTQQDLQRLGARTAIEAMNSAPGVTSGYLPGSIGSVSMRGFHRAVNYLYDGIRMANSDVGVRNWDSWSFDRIEVIKGPASVTSGEGALAGALNFVPRRPSLDGIGGEILASYGSFDTVRLAGDFNIPLGKTVAFRANASWSNSSGWIDDADSSSFAATGSLLFQPGDRFKVTLSADYFEDDLAATYYGTPVISPALARDPSNVVSGNAGLVLDKAMRRLNFNVTDNDTNSQTLWLRARAELEISDTLKVVSDTSWYTSDRIWQDADEYSFNAGTGLINRGMTLISHDHQFWNQRLHLAADHTFGKLRNRFTTGFEASGTDFFTLRRFGSAAAVDPFAPVRGSFATDTPANFGTRQNVNAEVESLAFFAEDALNLTPEWLLVGGIRYDDIDLDRRVLTVTSGAVQTYGQDYDPITWRIGTVYSIQPETQLFAQYTSAVTPLSGFLFISAANAAFKLTSGESCEVGFKTSLVNNRIQLTGSLFHIRQDDILTRDPANPAVAFQGGSIKSEGGELAFSWAATEELNIALSGTLLDAKLVNLHESGGINRSGNRPPNVSGQVADLVVTYAPRNLPVTLTGKVQHNGDFYTSNANSVKVSGYTTFDAALAWNAPFGTVTLRGRNLTDAFYADWSGYVSGLLFVGAPRSVDLTFTKRF